MSKTYNLCVYIFLTANFFPFLLNRGEMNKFYLFWSVNGKAMNYAVSIFSDPP